MPTILTEQIDLSEAQVDSDNRVIKDVVLIRAGMSLNRRMYSEAVIQKAAPLFEGTRAFDSHAKGERRVGELTGYYTNVRYSEGRLLADRHFTRTQAGNDVWSVVEDIVRQKAPRSLAGLSINAVGSGKPRKYDDGEGLEVESITAANSVDDVINAAAGGGYSLTAGGGDALALALMQAMTLEEFTEARPDFIQRLQKEWKTMRDGEAVKAAVAAKEAALADADQAAETLKEAQATITRLEQEREAAVTTAETARRALVIEQTLNAPQIKLSAAWKTELRTQLAESDPQTWSSQIERYQKLAASAGQKPPVSVSGAAQQVSPAGAAQRPLDPLVVARRRLAEASSPEALLRIQESLER